MSSLHSSICSFSLFWEMAKHRRLDPCRKVESAWLEFQLWTFQLSTITQLYCQLSTFNNYSSILPILQLSTNTLTCIANTGCPCSHGKDRESHQFQQNLSRPRLAWYEWLLRTDTYAKIDIRKQGGRVTNLISPCLLSIQYWLPPWLWQGQRPTGLCRSSLLPGLLMNWCQNEIHIKLMIQSQTYGQSQGWTTGWNICTILSTCQCTDCSIHSSPLRLRLPRQEWKVQDKPETDSTWQLSHCFTSQTSWFAASQLIVLLVHLIEEPLEALAL